MERTLVVITPAAVQRELYGEVFARLMRVGFKLVGHKFTNLTLKQTEDYFADHEGKPFFRELVEYYLSGPVGLVVLEGRDVVEKIRKVVGTSKLESGTINGEFSYEIARRAVLTSISPSEANREIRVFFTRSELVIWNRATETWIHE